MFQKREFYTTILLGLVLLILPFITSPDLSSGWALLKIEPFQHSLLRYVFLVIFLFVNYYYIIPNFYITKRWVWLTIILIVSYIIIAKLPSLLLGHNGEFPEMPLFDEGEMMPENPMPPPGFENGMPFNPNNMPKPNGSFFRLNGFVIQFLIVCVLSVIIRLNTHLRAVQNQKLEAEVSYLKAQINPHFLFNTLNNIYALALKKSDTTADAVLKLSGMMRYMVTEINSDKVLLQKEIDYIEDYISLQKLRLNTCNDFVFKVLGNTQQQQIAPMILINFIENAFKYGVSSHQKSHIHIHMNVTESHLEFTAENSIVKKTSTATSTGNGIKNSKKRLEMIYPNAHQLSIDQTDTLFKVTLKIDLI